MSRRFLFPLATGVVVLVGMSPVLAAEQSTPAANKPAKATTTTAAADDSAANPGADGNDSTATSGTATTGTSGKGSTNTTGKGSTNTTGKGSTATTAAPAPGGPQRSTTMCDQPETNQQPAPQVGDAPQTFEAGEAGNVEVERLTETELRVAKATANDGWNAQVAQASGPRITVKFTRSGQSPTLIRFAASMDQKGTMIHTRVTSCG